MAVLGKPLLKRAKVDSARIAQWFASSKGQRLLRCEQQLLTAQLQRMYGSYALIYNDYMQQTWQTQVKRCVQIGQPELPVQIQCAENNWPVQPDSVDLVLLQHSLEFAGSAHELLREAAQSVRPGGHIIIVAINPYSWFSLARLFGGKPWRQARCYSSARVGDWLTLLGFQLERCSFDCYRPLAISREDSRLNLLERFLQKKQWPLGNCYMLVARKMRPGSFLQARRKLALDKIMPLPAATASRSGNLDKQTHHD